MQLETPKKASHLGLLKALALEENKTLERQKQLNSGKDVCLHCSFFSIFCSSFGTTGIDLIYQNVNHQTKSARDIDVELPHNLPPRFNENIGKLINIDCKQSKD